MPEFLRRLPDPERNGAEARAVMLHIYRAILGFVAIITLVVLSWAASTIQTTSRDVVILTTGFGLFVEAQRASDKERDRRIDRLEEEFKHLR